MQSELGILEGKTCGSEVQTMRGLQAMGGVGGAHSPDWTRSSRPALDIEEERVAQVVGGARRHRLDGIRSDHFSVKFWDYAFDRRPFQA